MKGTLSNQSKQHIISYIRREAKEAAEKIDKIRLCAILA
jgi:hypothetical protein